MARRAGKTSAVSLVVVVVAVVGILLADAINTIPSSNESPGEWWRDWPGVSVSVVDLSNYTSDAMELERDANVFLTGSCVAQALVLEELRVLAQANSTSTPYISTSCADFLHWDVFLPLDETIQVRMVVASSSSSSACRSC